MGVYEDEAGARRANQNGRLKVIAALGVFGFFGYQVYGFISAGGVDTSDADARRLALMDAEVLCQEAIRRAAKNPSGAKIPPGSSRGVNADGPGYVVNWSHGAGLRLQNGFGALIDTTASCVAVNNRVISLVLDGEKVL